MHWPHIAPAHIQYSTTGYIERRDVPYPMLDVVQLEWK